jgi:hypothetical protein
MFKKSEYLNGKVRGLIVNDTVVAGQKVSEGHKRSTKTQVKMNSDITGVSIYMYNSPA